MILRYRYLCIAYFLTVIVFAALLIAAFAGSPSMPIAERIMDLTFLGWIAVLWRFGSLRISGLRYALAFLFLILLAGAVFKIQHWPYANELLSVALGGMLFIYLLHFLEKPQHDSYPVAKLLWVGSSLMIRLLIVTTHSYRILALIPIVLLLIVLYLFLQRLQIAEFRRNQIPES